MCDTFVVRVTIYIATNRRPHRHPYICTSFLLSKKKRRQEVNVFNYVVYLFFGNLSLTGTWNVFEP